MKLKMDMIARFHKGELAIEIRDVDDELFIQLIREMYPFQADDIVHVMKNRIMETDTRTCWMFSTEIGINVLNVKLDIWRKEDYAKKVKEIVKVYAFFREDDKPTGIPKFKKGDKVYISALKNIYASQSMTEKSIQGLAMCEIDDVTFNEEMERCEYSVHLMNRLYDLTPDISLKIPEDDLALIDVDVTPPIQKFKVGDIVDFDVEELAKFSGDLEQTMRQEVATMKPTVKILNAKYSYTHSTWLYDIKMSISSKTWTGLPEIIFR